MTRIKFCGVTRGSDAAQAAALGASHIGVILTESPRRMTPLQARAVFAAAPGPRRVGVFRHLPLSDLLNDASAADLEVLQLHGRFTPDEMALLREGFDGELWSVIPMDGRHPGIPENWLDLADITDALVLDTSVRGMTGGTGATFDWKAAEPFVREAATRTTIVLAGGLTPSNVADAIRTLAPGVVDVSSGVETAPGVKDPALMRAFADAVRAASIV